MNGYSSNSLFSPSELLVWCLSFQRRPAKRPIWFLDTASQSIISVWSRKLSPAHAFRIQMICERYLKIWYIVIYVYIQYTYIHTYKIHWYSIYIYIHICIVHSLSSSNIKQTSSPTCLPIPLECPGRIPAVGASSDVTRGWLPFKNLLYCLLLYCEPKTRVFVEDFFTWMLASYPKVLKCHCVSAL